MDIYMTFWFIFIPYTLNSDVILINSHVIIAKHMLHNIERGGGGGSVY